jgi:hypothetical protein
MHGFVVTVRDMQRCIAADARKRQSRLHGNIRLGSMVGLKVGVMGCGVAIFGLDRDQSDIGRI